MGRPTMEDSHEVKMRKMQLELQRLSQQIDLLCQAWGMSPDAAEKPLLKNAQAVRAKNVVNKKLVRKHKNYR